MSDPRQRQQNINLAATKLAVVVAELGADTPLVPARVNAGGRALATDVGEGLVDEEAVAVAAEALEGGM